MQPDISEDRPETWETRRERFIVGGLCLFAAIHVFIFCAAFPFFTNVDEAAQLGTLLKFAHGEVPRSFDAFSGETVRCQALYSSPFYLGGATYRSGANVQPWRLPPAQRDEWIAANASRYGGTNYQNSQPPIYYAVVSTAWKAGGAMGVDDGRRLYWMRFVNVPFVVVAVWLGWWAARLVFPASSFHRLAVPALLAFMPQSAFYSLESDTFSPVFFGLAFVLLLRLSAAETPSVWLGAAAGLALAGAFLVKMTNVPPLMVAAGFFLSWVWRLWRTGELGRWFTTVAALGLCALVPAATWSIWCKQTFGDFTGTRIKAEFWTWAPKPLADWWPHPIFTLPGAKKFLALFLSEFWQGEFTWHVQPMALRLPSWIYEITTVALLAVVLVALLRRPALLTELQRRALWFGFFAFTSCAAFLAYVSISYNFNHCPIPNPEFPYLTIGRQALGALIPFMLVFVTGLNTVMFRATPRTKFLVLGIILAAMLGAEIVTDRRAFGDPYNWFYL
jgi:hypothetical protein